MRLSLHTQPSEALTMQSPAGQVKADKDDITSFLDALANAVSLSGLASTEANRLFNRMKAANMVGVSRIACFWRKIREGTSG